MNDAAIVSSPVTGITSDEEAAELAHAAVSGITKALQEAHAAKSNALREAEAWKVKAQEWQQKCEQQEHLVTLLRSHSSVSGSGGGSGRTAFASTDDLAIGADSFSGGESPQPDAMQRSSSSPQCAKSLARRNTLPTLPSVRTERPAAVKPQQPRQGDPTAALRTLAQHCQLPAGSVPPQATLGSLASMLMAASFLQPGRRITVENAGVGSPHSATMAERSDSGEADNDAMQHVSVDDDGASGVGAAAAAAMSVALARSWALTANQTQGSLEQTANGGMRLGRAGFRLTAARPRAGSSSLRHSHSTAEMLSPTAAGSNGSSPARGGALGAALRHQAREKSAPALMHLGDCGSPRTDSGLSSLRPTMPSRALSEQPLHLGATLKLQWLSAPATVLLVAKPTPKVQDALQQVVAWLLQRRISVVLEPQVLEQHGAKLAEAARMGNMDRAPPHSTRRGSLRSWTAEQAVAEGTLPHHVPRSVADVLDLVVTLGGDGTVLWTAALLGVGPAPPLVSFAMGSLGFMTPFALDTMPSVLSSVLQGGFSLMLRHRLHCTIIRGPKHCGGDASNNGSRIMPDVGPSQHEVLNELVMDRGMSPYLTSLDCFCDGNYVTNVQGDGLIVATPTGSTAYNLAAGGSMVHPEVPGILFTPICPHSLTSRALVFPDHVQLRIEVPQDSRADMWCSFDGKGRQRLCPGDAVVVRTSAWPFPMVCKLDASHDWFLSMQQGLSWNSRQRQAGVGS